MGANAGVHGIINIPAIGILLVLTGLLIRGTRESAFVNSLIVVTKVAIVLIVIVIGWGFMDPANHTPYIPAATTFTTAQGVTHPYGGIMGILGAAGVVFFAYIGFDAVSTAAQEAKDPKRDMPIGILGSLAICTILYVLFAHVLSGVATVNDFRTAGKEASVAFAITKYMTGYAWLAKLVTVAILAGFFFYIARNLGLPVALEGALKMKEISYVPSDAYAAGEMKHGPIALLSPETPTIAVAVGTPVIDKLASNVAEVKTRGSSVLAVASEDDPRITEYADETIFVPALDWRLQPILAVLPLQLLALETAECRGLNVDQPRNLAKTVTVE